MKKNILLTCMLFFASSAAHAHDTSSAVDNTTKPSIHPTVLASYKASYESLTQSYFSPACSPDQLMTLVRQVEELRKTLESYTEQNICRNSMKQVRPVLQNVDSLLNKYLQRTSNELSRLLPKLAELEQLKIERALQDHSLALACAITTESEFSPAFEQLLDANNNPSQEIPGLFTTEDLSPDNESGKHPAGTTEATTRSSEKSLSREDRIRMYKSAFKKHDEEMQRISSRLSAMSINFSQFLEEKRLAHTQLIQQVSTTTELTPKINKSNALFCMFHSRLKVDLNNWQTKQEQLLIKAQKERKRYLDRFLEAQRLFDEDQELADEFEYVKEEEKKEEQLEDTFESI